MAREYKLFIGGEWVDGADVLDIKSPYDESIVGRVHRADESLVERAIQAGVEGQRAMSKLAPVDRRELCHQVARGLTERSDEMAEIIRDEAGKPIKVCRGEVQRAVETFEFAAEEAWRMAEPSIELGAVPTGRGRFGIVRRYPVGLVSAISPFNFPLNLVAHKLAPAFATGCAVVLKPASQTPMSSLLLAEITKAAGIPSGGLNVTVCSRAAADAFTVDERFKLLSFTGSPGVGWTMKARAGKKKVVLELGGNAAAIVDKDADLDAAAARIATGAFTYAGQICISVQRVMVHEAVAAEFEPKFVAATKALAVGDPKSEKTICGPLIDAKNAGRIVDWIEEAKAKGGKVLVGGTREGNVVQPCIVKDAPADSKLGCEEAFGPVCTLETVKDIDDAIARCNDSVFGLQAGVFTDSIQAIWKCFEELEVGGVIQNDIPTFRVDNMPYGGVKDSGFGREGVQFAIDDYTELRLLALKPGGPVR